jgi:hypothetical protein
VARHVKFKRKIMSLDQNTPTVRIAPNNPVFDLPVIVAIEERLFEAAGLDVQFSATYADREKDVEKPIMFRLKEQLFDCGWLRRQLQCLRMGEHRPAGAWNPYRQHRRPAGGGRRAGDPVLRRQAAGAA